MVNCLEQFLPIARWAHDQVRDYGIYREQLVFSVDDLPSEPRFLGIKGVLPVQHCIQNDAAAPDVRNLQLRRALSAPNMVIPAHNTLKLYE